jgi:long-chain fatty acid transport protein
LASGFALLDQNVSGLGVAYAGAGAVVDDPSTVFFNAAGLTRFESPTLSVSTIVLDADSRFRNRSSQAAVLQPLGGSGGNAGAVNALPAIYAALPVSDALTLGFGINAPFGLSTVYDADSSVRFQARRSQIQAQNIELAIAYRLNDAVSVGVGVDVQRVDVELTTAINYSGVIAQGLQLFGLASPDLLAANAGLQGGNRFRGNDTAVGFDLGVAIDVTPSTRLGAAYRSSIDYTIEGTSRVTTPAFPEPTGAAVVQQAQSLVPALSTASAKADVKLPGSARIAVVQRVGTQLDLLASVEHTDWSTLQELRLVRRADGQEIRSIPTEWRDTWRYSLGATYAVNDRLKLRIGAAYDQSPVPNGTREPRIPDDDRTIVGLGAQLRPTEAITVDLGYSHVFIADATLRSDSEGQGAQFGVVNGTQHTHADLYGVQVTVGF